MKKAYIIPNARVITLFEEHELMNTQSLQSLGLDPDNDKAVESVDLVWSNKRQGMWGEEE